MAGEWLKFECSLPEKPETLAITVAMGWEDPDLTVGKLMRLFRWFDQHTLDGNAHGVTPALLDRIIGVSGFVSAVAKTGWVVIGETSVALHNFDHHNGATAKSRAQTAKRVAKHKTNGLGNAEANGVGNADSVSAALPREEKKKYKKTLSGLCRLRSRPTTSHNSMDCLAGPKRTRQKTLSRHALTTFCWPCTASSAQR